MFNIYKNKKFFITGHTGFKGSWLTIWLVKIGAEVIGYGLDPRTKRDNYELSGIKKYIKEYRADIRDKEKLIKVVKDEKPDIIFHFAAQPLVLESYKDPLYTIETNTLGTTYILEAFKFSNTAKALIVVTTDKVYLNKEWTWGYRENDQLGGKDIYSASKAAAELIIDAYRKSFLEKENKLVASVRAGNVIGGGDWSENRIVPDCIKAIEKGSTIKVRNPEAVRPWQHVLEPLSGYLLLGEYLLKGKDSFADAWNFGPLVDNFLSVEQLVKLIIKEYGKGNYKIIGNGTYQEAKYLSLDISKAIRKLKWKPVLKFHETIKLTIEWYKKYKYENVFNICLSQINEFIDLWNLARKD